MFKQIIATAAAVLFLSTPALADAAAGSPSTAKTPVLSGSYVWSWSESCLGGTLSTSVMSGVITFDPKTGAATLKGWHASANGTNTYVLSTENLTGTYSNTAKTLTFNSGTASESTYQVTYGAVTGGIATYLSLIAAAVETDNVSCADLATLMRQ
jgi:hypothetical protein